MATETMGLSDRDWLYLTGAMIAIAVIWYAWRQAHQDQPAQTPSEAEGALPIPWSEPMTGVFDANPDANAPATNNNLALTISNPYAAMLDSAYMPMFGFVGMAQGAMFNG